MNFDDGLGEVRDGIQGLRGDRFSVRWQTAVVFVPERHKEYTMDPSSVDDKEVVIFSNMLRIGAGENNFIEFSLDNGEEIFFSNDENGIREFKESGDDWEDDDWEDDDWEE